MVVAGLIAFGVPGGCGSEPEVIPLEVLPGEAVETARAASRALAAASRRPGPSRPGRRAVSAGGGRVRRGAERRGWVERRCRLSVPVVRVPPRRRAAPAARVIPEAAREFSFDR